MVFVVGHYTSEQQMLDYAQQYQLGEYSILYCGSTSFDITPNANYPYHPLYKVMGEPSVKEQHHYIDTMMRAIQIEHPVKVIFASASKFDTKTALQRIKEHCDIVDVMVEG
jgi:hypothetical protein